MDSEALPSAPLRIGDALMNFTARSTKGPLSLSDFRGQWLVIFSHPADFTPVCTSEFVAIAKASAQFEALNCALMALSVDSLFSHLAWTRMIRDRFDVTIDFPIVEDPTMAIGRAYGMVAPDAHDASAIRATYFVDPEGILRASTCYPASIGRSVVEMLRMVEALQRAQDGTALVPADWQPGDELLRTPSQCIEEVLAAADPTAWFYTQIPDKGAK
ncbi:peroxiredoxin [Altererythrobacter indicus]|uniref:Thioredoxin peroxidase n=2 Tax=Altericroceibacterium indicum TaxID=374177 RepID=A0A845A9X4_9SPHN|nr:peroxiredoxin [Altericroceibacterium indicum]